MVARSTGAHFSWRASKNSEEQNVIIHMQHSNYLGSEAVVILTTSRENILSGVSTHWWEIGRERLHSYRLKKKESNLFVWHPEERGDTLKGKWKVEAHPGTQWLSLHLRMWLNARLFHQTSHLHAWERCTEPELILKKLRACVTKSRFMDFSQWGNVNLQTKRAPAVPTMVKKWLLARRGHMVSKESMKRWGMWRYQLQLNLHINQRCDCLKADVLFPCTQSTLKTLWENDC